VKFCIVGGKGVGKTNIRRIITGMRFKRNISPTVGSDFSFKEINSDEIRIKSMIWDLSGGSKYKKSRGLYLQGIQGGFLVFDITDENSFLELEEWINDIEQTTVNKGGFPLIILANKSDLIPISAFAVTEDRIIKFVNSIVERFEHKFDVSYIFTSASTGQNIEEAFLQLVKNALEWIDNRKIQ